MFRALIKTKKYRDCQVIFYETKIIRKVLNHNISPTLKMDLSFSIKNLACIVSRFNLYAFLKQNLISFVVSFAPGDGTLSKM